MENKESHSLFLLCGGSNSSICYHLLNNYDYLIVISKVSIIFYKNVKVLLLLTTSGVICGTKYFYD